MAWRGKWIIEYKGNNKDKFINTAKLIIPKFKDNYEISDDNSEVSTKRNIRWYSADIDIEKILSYLDDGDQIHVLIDGETHPIREVISEGGYVDKGVADENNYDYSKTDLTTGVTTYHFQEEYIEPEYDYYDWEEQFFKKQDGKVTVEYECFDEDRPGGTRYGIKEDFIYELSHPDQVKEEVLRGGTFTIDAYIKYIAGEINDIEQMALIIYDFLNEVMEISKEDIINRCGKLDEQTFADFNKIKSKFQSVESTKEYLTEVKSKLPPKKEEEKLAVPKVFSNMSKSDINKLGGVETLVRLYEEKGAIESIKILTQLGYDLNSGKYEKGKRKSSVQIKRERKQVNKNIRDSVVNYFLGCVKAKYPNLTPENEKIFTEELGRIVDRKLEYGGWACSLNIDYDPCSELISAFHSMDMSNFDSGYPLHGVFPMKTSVHMEIGKFATVSSEFRESRILYMTDEYKQELSTAINTRIMQEESKIPQKIKDEFEQEYQTLINELTKERELLAKREEIISAIRQSKDIVTIKKLKEQLKIIETNIGWQTLEDFDEEHNEDFDKNIWLENKYIEYARDEYRKIYEKHEKEHPHEFSSPDTSSIPNELDRLYAQRRQIRTYNEIQEKLDNNIKVETGIRM